MPDGDFNPDDLLIKATPASATMTVTPAAKPAVDPTMRQFLDTMIAPGESSGAYNVIYGGQKVDDLSQHPDIAVPITEGPNVGKNSTAAGKYQFIKSTWDSAAKALGLKDFSPESQDAAAAWLAKKTYLEQTGRDLEKDYASGDPSLRSGIRQALAGQWESLGKPGPRIDKLWSVGNDRYRFADDAMAPHEGKDDTDLVYMKPADYLSLSPSMESDAGYSLSGWQSLRRSLAAGEPVKALPTLQTLDGKVTGQDGRSRALLAQLSGLDAIPVAINHEGETRPDELVGMNGASVPANAYASAKQFETKKDGESLVARFLGIGSAQAAEPSADPRLEAVDHDPFAAPADPKLEAVDHNPFAPEKPAGDGLPWDVPMTGDQMRAAQAKAAKADKTQSAFEPDPGLMHMLASPFLAASRAGQAALGERPPLEPTEMLSAAAMGATPSVVNAATSGLRELDTGHLSRPLSERLKPSEWTPEQVQAAADKIRAPLVARAQDIVTKRMNEDAPTTAQEAIDSFNKAREAGKPVILPDVFQDNVQSLTGRMARIPGEPKQTITKALTARNAEAVNRLTADIDQALGSGGAYQAREALANARRTAARPKYEAAFSRIKVTPDEAAQVERFIADPIGQDALQHGMRVIQLEHLRDGTSFKPADYGVVRDESGKWKLEGDQRNLRLYDAVKRGYDEIVEGFRDKTTGKLVLNQYGNAVNGVRGVYTGELRSLFPRYGSALDAWGGPSRSMDALQAGADALKRSPEQNAARLASMSENDQEFAKLGLAQTLRDIANKRGPLAGEFDRIAGTRYGSASTREQLRPFFKDEESLRKFMDSVTTETTMARTSNRVLSGSPTAARLSEDESALSPAEAAHTAVNLATGNHMGLVRSAIRGGQSLLDRQKVQRNAEISKILSDPNVQLGLDPKGKITILPSPADAATQGKP